MRHPRPTRPRKPQTHTRGEQTIIHHVIVRNTRRMYAITCVIYTSNVKHVFKNSFVYAFAKLPVVVVCRRERSVSIPSVCCCPSAIGGRPLRPLPPRTGCFRSKPTNGESARVGGSSFAVAVRHRRGAAFGDDNVARVPIERALRLTATVGGDILPVHGLRNTRVIVVTVVVVSVGDQSSHAGAAVLSRVGRGLLLLGRPDPLLVVRIDGLVFGRHNQCNCGNGFLPHGIPGGGGEAVRVVHHHHHTSSTTRRVVGTIDARHAAAAAASSFDRSLLRGRLGGVEWRRRRGAATAHYERINCCQGCWKTVEWELFDDDDEDKQCLSSSSFSGIVWWCWRAHKSREARGCGFGSCSCRRFVFPVSRDCGVSDRQTVRKDTFEFQIDSPSFVCIQT